MVNAPIGFANWCECYLVGQKAQCNLESMTCRFDCGTLRCPIEVIIILWYDDENKNAKERLDPEVEPKMMILKSSTVTRRTSSIVFSKL